MNFIFDGDSRMIGSKKLMVNGEEGFRFIGMQNFEEVEQKSRNQKKSKKLQKYATLLQMLNGGREAYTLSMNCES